MENGDSQRKVMERQKRLLRFEGTNDIRDMDIHNTDICTSDIRNTDLRKNTDLQNTDICDTELRDTDIDFHNNGQDHCSSYGKIDGDVNTSKNRDSNYCNDIDNGDNSNNHDHDNSHNNSLVSNIHSSKRNSNKTLPTSTVSFSFDYIISSSPFVKNEKKYEKKSEKKNEIKNEKKKSSKYDFVSNNEDLDIDEFDDEWIENIKIDDNNDNDLSSSGNHCKAQNYGNSQKTVKQNHRNSPKSVNEDDKINEGTTKTHKCRAMLGEEAEWSDSNSLTARSTINHDKTNKKGNKTIQEMSEEDEWSASSPSSSSKSTVNETAKLAASSLRVLPSSLSNKNKNKNNKTNKNGNKTIQELSEEDEWSDSNTSITRSTKNFNKTMMKGVKKGNQSPIKEMGVKGNKSSITEGSEEDEWSEEENKCLKINSNHSKNGNNNNNDNNNNNNNYNNNNNRKRITSTSHVEDIKNEKENLKTNYISVNMNRDRGGVEGSEPRLGGDGGLILNLNGSNNIDVLPLKERLRLKMKDNEKKLKL
jgi:hypothetical protein